MGRDKQRKRRKEEQGESREREGRSLGSVLNIWILVYAVHDFGFQEWELLYNTPAVSLSGQLGDLHGFISIIMG